MVPRQVVAFLRPRAQAEPATLPAGLATAGAPVAPPALFASVVLHGAPGTRGTAFFLRAQAVFERYGLRPAYLLDAASAGQAAVCRTLRRVHDEGGCGIGAWWDGKAGRARVAALAEAIAAGCGVEPSFTSAEAAAAIPIVAGQLDPVAGLIAIPLTRGMVVPMAPSVPEREDMAHDVALLPDSIASEPQIMLMRAMLARGERRFFLRLHVRQDDARGSAALDRLARVCAWFFEELGGLPGDIRALTADRRRRPRADALLPAKVA